MLIQSQLPREYADNETELQRQPKLIKQDLSKRYKLNFN